MKKDDKILRLIIDDSPTKEKINTMHTLNNFEKGMLNEYEHLWEKSAEVSHRPMVDAERDWQIVRKRMGFNEVQSKRIPAFKYFARIAAVLVLAIGLAIFLNKVVQQANTAANGYITQSAQNEKVNLRLPDGSRVMLNRHSSVQYPATFNTQNRDVILSGEAYFEVSRNESLPFRVFVETSVVEVLGTSFNIRSVDTMVYLTVTSGLVKFYDNNNTQTQLQLTKDQDAVYSVKNHTLRSLSGHDVNQLSWRTGYFVFNSAPLGEVISNLAGYYNLSFDESDVVFDSLTFTGTFNNKSLDEIIQIINLTLSKDVELVATGKHLVLRKQN